MEREEGGWEKEKRGEEEGKWEREEEGRGRGKEGEGGNEEQKEEEEKEHDGRVLVLPKGAVAALLPWRRRCRRCLTPSRWRSTPRILSSTRRWGPHTRIAHSIEGAGRAYKSALAVS